MIVDTKSAKAELPTSYITQYFSSLFNFCFMFFPPVLQDKIKNLLIISAPGLIVRIKNFMFGSRHADKRCCLYAIFKNRDCTIIYHMVISRYKDQNRNFNPLQILFLHQCHSCPHRCQKPPVSASIGLVSGIFQPFFKNIIITFS